MQSSLAVCISISFPDSILMASCSITKESSDIDSWKNNSYACTEYSWVEEIPQKNKSRLGQNFPLTDGRYLEQKRIGFQ